jgi:transposase InsO family protein
MAPRSGRVIGTLRDGLLNGEIFFTLPEAEVLIERWRREYTQVRPHGGLDDRPPAPEAWSVDQTIPRTGRPASATGLQGAGCE